MLTFKSLTVLSYNAKGSYAISTKRHRHVNYSQAPVNSVQRKRTHRYRKVFQPSDQDEQLSLYFDKERYEDIDRLCDTINTGEVSLDLNYQNVFKLMNWYVKNKREDRVLSLFQKIEKPDYGHYNFVIDALGKNDVSSETLLSLYNEMTRKHIRINVLGINSILSALKREAQYDAISGWIDTMILSRTIPNEETIYYFLFALAKLRDHKKAFVVVELLVRAKQVQIEWAMVQFYMSQFVSKMPQEQIERVVAQTQAVWEWDSKDPKSFLSAEDIGNLRKVQFQLKLLKDEEGKDLFTLPFEAQHARIRW